MKNCVHRIYEPRKHIGNPVKNCMSTEFTGSGSAIIVFTAITSTETFWKPYKKLCVHRVYGLRKRNHCVSTGFTSIGNMTATQDRKPCGNASLSDAFPRLRTRGNVTYIRVSRSGYLIFRFRKLMFPLGNR